MSFFEKTLKEEEIYKGKVVELVVQDVQIINGTIAKREIIRHSGGVAVLAFLDSETVLFVEQFRKPFDSIMLELPAGKLEPGEDPKECGVRELEEETGYKCKSFSYLGKIISTPGYCNEVVYLYKAEHLFQGVKGGDSDEFINVKKLKINEVREKFRNGEITDAKTIAAFMHYFNEIIS